MALAAIPFGLALGLAFGMAGGGGSVLAVPVLVYVVGESVHSATTTSLLIVAAAALAGGYGHARRGLVCWRHAAAFAGPALGGVLVGAAANRSVSGDLLLALFVPLMVAGAWATWHRVSDPRAGPGGHGACPALQLGRDALAGCAVGVLTGFFGVGGGLVVVPTLTIALGFPLRSAIGTSLVIVGTVSLLGFTAHAAAGGSFDVGVTTAMTTACVAGTLAGSQLSSYVSLPALGRGFAVLVTGVAAYLVVAAAFLGGAPSG